MTSRDKKKILTVCHDTGSAEVVSAYAAKNRGRFSFASYAAGPAVPVFDRRKLRFAAIRDIKHARNEARGILEKHADAVLLLSGTSGGGSPLETAFIREAKRRGMRTASFLEHWVSYRERFSYPAAGWRKNLPDEIWVGDRAAERIACRLFPMKIVKVKFVPNPYFAEIKERFRALHKRKGSPRDILYLSDPVGYERAVLEDLLRLLVKTKSRRELIIRLHPVEPRDKYIGLVKRFGDKLRIRESKGGDLLQDIAKSSLVVGGRSNALVLAFLCGKKVIGVIPSGAKDKPLPFEGIKNVKRLSAKDLS